MCSFFGWPRWLVNLKSGSSWMFAIARTLKPYFIQQLNNQVSYTPSFVSTYTSETSSLLSMHCFSFTRRRVRGNSTYNREVTWLLKLEEQMGIMRSERNPKETKGNWRGMRKWKDVYSSMFALQGGASWDRHSWMARASSIAIVLCYCAAATNQVLIDFI